MHATTFPSHRLGSAILPLVLAGAALVATAARGQLFDELEALYGTRRTPVGDPEIEATVSPEGPKGIAEADFDGDGRVDFAVANADGTVTLLYGRGLQPAPFDGAVHLRTGGRTLRGIVAVDFDGDSRPDIAVADPVVGQVFVFLNAGAREFAAPTALDTWAQGGRNLVADDFDGDGNKDLVVGGARLGLRQYAGDGAGGFSAVTDIPELLADVEDGDGDDSYELQPVFTLRTFRPGGSALPKLAATHAETTKLWILGPDVGGVLRVEHVLFEDASNPEFLPLHDFAIAPVSAPLAAGVPDLITVSKERNVVTVWRGALAPPFFHEQAYQRFPIAGGPRAVKVADTNGDGWGDAGIVVRNFDKVLIYENQSGVLAPMAELATGRSPRDIVMPDLDGDGFADVAVICRKSRDVAVMRNAPAEPQGFVVPRQTYPTDGDVAGLAVADMNGDGRDDVLQLHRAPGDVSIRLTRTDGSLGPSAHFPMGIRTNGLRLGDLNNDGVPDVIVPSLGMPPSGGQLTYRFGDGAGGLGEIQTILPPPDPGTNGILRPGMFALVTADLDGDGIQDQVGGYYDCRVTFFRGLPGGGYETTYTTSFVYESRVMVAGDFDQDGDIDIAGVGAAGEGVVLINDGDLLGVGTPRRYDFRFGNGGKTGASSAVLNDLNGDGDPDMVVTTDGGAVVLLGTAGVGFMETGKLPSVQSILSRTMALSTIVQGDFDGDGDTDLAIGCGENAMLEIHTVDEGGIFGLALEVSVPSAEFVATGDLDGDGLADLVGTGSVLWTALSGGDPASDPVAETSRPRLTGIVINEIFPRNDSIPVTEDGGRRPDVVEVFNGGLTTVSLEGWRLGLLAAETGETRAFVVTAAVAVPSGGRAVFVCSDKDPRSPLHTGYKLPREGGTLTLSDATGVVVDEVFYPELDADISFARFGDATGTFFFNAYPDPGAPNLDNGVIGPELAFLGTVPLRPRANESLRFLASARDDIGIVTVDMRWRRLDGNGDVTGQVPLYDDGMHDDGGMLDGLYAGTLAGGFPDGAQIEFYLVVTDLSGARKTRPDEPLFSAPGLPLRNYSLSVGSANNVPSAIGLQISEVAASNSGLILDEAGEAEDWIEVRNTSAGALSLDGIGLAESTIVPDDRVFRFPEGTTLEPGGYLIVWADEEPGEGPFHAPFRLSVDGEAVFIVGRTELDAVAVVDAVSWESITEGLTLAAIGDPTWAIHREQRPTPGRGNLFAGIEALSPARFPELSEVGLNFAFATEAGRTFVVEVLRPNGVWSEFETGTGTGAEALRSVPFGAHRQRLFRVRHP